MSSLSVILDRPTPQIRSGHGPAGVARSYRTRLLNLDVGRLGANEEFTHLLNHTLKSAMVELSFIKAWVKVKLYCQNRPVSVGDLHCQDSPKLQGDDYG